MTTDSKQVLSPSATASAAGIGGGTLVAVFASSLPEAHPYRALLIYAAPSISITIRLCCVLLQAEIANFIQNWKIRATINSLRKMLRRSIDDPTTSVEHKIQLQQRLEFAERLEVDRAIQQIQGLTPVTISSVVEAERITNSNRERSQ